MRSYVVEGNTIRELEERYDRPFKRNPSPQVIRNRERAAHMNFGYVAFLIIMAGVLFIGCTAYINLRNNLIANQKEVERLESRVAALRLENEEEYDRIMGAVDMEEIKRVAMNELNMKYPDSGQVSVTESHDSDYVRQYKEIPKK